MPSDTGSGRPTSSPERSPRRARAYGLGPFVLENYEDAERDALLWLAANHAVDGVILTTPWNENEQLHRELAERGMPFVLLPRPEGLDSPGVRSRDDDGAAMLVRHLVEFGHRRFGLIGGQPDIDLTRLKLKGYDRAMVDAGLDPHAAPRVLKDYTFQTGYDAARRMLEKPGRPTALVCLSDLLGAGALRAAHEMGLRIPDDLSVVGMGDLMAG